MREGGGEGGEEYPHFFGSCGGINASGDGIAFCARPAGGASVALEFETFALERDERGLEREVDWTDLCADDGDARTDLTVGEDEEDPREKETGVWTYGPEDGAGPGCE